MFYWPYNPPLDLITYHDAFVLHHAMSAGGLLKQPDTAFPRSVDKQ